MPQLKQISSSDQNTVLTQLEAEILTSINVHRVAIVKKVDEFRIEVQPCDLMENTTINGMTTTKYPPLKCMWLAAKNMIAMLNVDDIVLVGFNDISLSNASEKKNQQISQSDRRHDLSDGLILGVLQYSQPDNTKIGFAYGEDSDAVEMTVSTEKSLTLNAGINKVEMKNNDMDLKLVLNDVVDALNKVKDGLDSVVSTLDAFKVLGTGNMGSPVNSVAVPGQTTSITADITQLSTNINTLSTDLNKLLV